MINNNATNSTILLFTFNNIQGRGLQTAIEQQLGQPVLLAKGAEVELPHYRDEHYMAIGRQLPARSLGGQNDAQ